MIYTKKQLKYKESIMSSALMQLNDSQKLLSYFNLDSESQIDFKKVVSNLKNLVPEYNTLLELTKLQEPTNLEEYLVFLEGLNHNDDTNFLVDPDLFIGKVTFLDSNLAEDFYNRYPQIGITVKAYCKKLGISKVFRSYGCDGYSVKNETYDFKVASYYVFIEMVADTIKLLPAYTVFKDALIESI